MSNRRAPWGWLATALIVAAVTASAVWLFATSPIDANPYPANREPADGAIALNGLYLDPATAATIITIGLGALIIVLINAFPESQAAIASFISRVRWFWLVAAAFIIVATTVAANTVGIVAVEYCVSSELIGDGDTSVDEQCSPGTGFDSTITTFVIAVGALALAFSLLYAFRLEARSSTRTVAPGGHRIDFRWAAGAALFVATTAYATLTFAVSPAAPVCDESLVYGMNMIETMDTEWCTFPLQFDAAVASSIILAGLILTAYASYRAFARQPISVAIPGGTAH